MAKDKFLTVAFTDLNGNGKFNANGDALIAAVVDTNHDKIVSVGDTVTFGTYPHVNGTQAGTFQGADAIITSVTDATSTQVLVSVGDDTIEWRAQPEVETFRTTDGGNTESSFFDGIVAGTKADQIFVDSAVNGPGLPDTTVVESTLRVGDDGFLDVLIA